MTVKIWNVADGKNVSSMKCETEPMAVSFSPDSRFLLCLEKSGRIRVISVADGKTVKEWQAHEKSDPFFAEYSRDGKYIVTGCSSVVKLWAAATFKHLRDYVCAEDIKVWNDEKKGYEWSHQDNAMISSVAVSSDSKLLACASCSEMAQGRYGAGEIRIWKIGNKKATKTFSSGNVHSISFMPGGDIIAAGTESKYITLLDAVGGDEHHAGDDIDVAGKDRFDNGCVETVLYSPDGKTIAVKVDTGAGNGSDDAMSVKILSVPDYKIVSKIFLSGGVPVIKREETSK